MRREYFIFLILIVAAAVITGSTIGFASNFNIIASQLNSPQTASVDEQVMTTDNEITAIDVINIDNNETAFVIDSELNITEKEQEQIIEMLRILGMVNTSDYNQFIKDFQTKHSLSPTGTLDSKTLNLIIEQVKLQQTSRSLNNAR